jgi:hypothetical protein
MYHLALYQYDYSEKEYFSTLFLSVGGNGCLPLESVHSSIHRTDCPIKSGTLHHTAYEIEVSVVQIGLLLLANTLGPDTHQASDESQDLIAHQHLPIRKLERN